MQKETSIVLMMNYWNSKMNNKTYINHSGSKVLEYYPPDAVLLDLHFILISDKKLKIGYPYLKTEYWLADSKTEAIRLLEVWDSDGIVYLKIQSLTTLKIDTLSWNLEYTGGFWLWSIASLNYVISTTDRKNSNALDDKELFDSTFKLTE
jgi:hypothetical protein